MLKPIATSIVVLAAGLLAGMGVQAVRLSEPPTDPQVTPPVSVPAATPSHPEMAKRIGKWTMVRKQTDRNRPTLEGTGTAKITSVLGGRYLREENEGVFDGKPFASEGLEGYSERSGRFEVVWTGSDRIIFGTGHAGDDHASIQYSSSYNLDRELHRDVEAYPQAHPIEHLAIDMRLIDDDHFVVTVKLEFDIGPEFGGRITQTTYSRVK